MFTQALEACLGGTWAGIWGAGTFVPPGKGQEHTYCMLEVCGHAHAQLHLVQGQVQLLTHLLPQGQQHLQGTGDSRAHTPGQPHQLPSTDPGSCLSLMSPPHRTCNSHTSHGSTLTVSGGCPDLLTTHRRLKPHLGLQNPGCSFRAWLGATPCRKKPHTCTDTGTEGSAQAVPAS